MKKLLILTVFLGNLAIFSQSEKSELRVFTFNEVEILHQQKPKPILVFLYTDWCKICFGMKNNTFKNDKVVRLLNDKFYFVKLNAEQKEDVIFFGKTFVYKPSGNKTGINELAKELGSIDGKISYPTTTILNSNLEIDLQIGNYINSKNMHMILMKFLTLNKN